VTTIILPVVFAAPSPASLPSELYLGIAAVLIFSACFIAAKKNRLPLKRKQILLIALLAMITVFLIWKLVGIWSKRSEPTQPDKLPTYSPPETAVCTKSGLLAGAISAGAGSIDTISNSVEPSSRFSNTVSPTFRPSSA
jgi:hypothetical protein